jgi:hypothetical protein
MLNNIFSKKEEVNEFSDFKDKTFPLDGEKISINEVLNKRLKYKDFRVGKSKYEDKGDVCLTVQVEYNGENRVFFTGSSVLTNIFQKYEDRLPFMATLKSVGKSYTFL